MAQLVIQKELRAKHAVLIGVVKCLDVAHSVEEDFRTTYVVSCPGHISKNFGFEPKLILVNPSGCAP